MTELGDASFENCAAWSDLNARVTACRACPRLVAWREEVAREKRRAFRDQEYWGKPVPGFGDLRARLLIVGLAPGAHGSNRTGRMFTGDASGDFLFPALYRAGFASQPHSVHPADGLALRDVYITAVGRCAPPDNKPTAQELDNCRPFLLEEMALLTRIEGVVALGSIAFHQVLNILKNKAFQVPPVEFSHGGWVEIESGPWVLASYHPSRQNTQTGRLSAAMFDSIWQQARARLDGSQISL